MNILHIISGGEKGGSKNILLSLVEGLKSREGIKCIVVCFLEGPLYEEAKAKKLDIRLIRQKSRFDLSSIDEIKSLCQSENIDIINCHGGRANFAGYLLMKKYKAKYVSTIHSDYKEDYRGNLYKTLVFSNLNKQVLKSFDYYITVSHSFKEMLIHRGFRQNRVFVVYNGIDFSKALTNLDREDIVKQRQLPAASHYVALVARFHPVKGHMVFLDACSRVLKEFKDVVFILVGDGAIRRELEDYTKELGINDKVFFAGFIKPDEYIYVSDFTIVASYTESFPLTILESAMYNKTVVSTEVGGVNKVIEEGVTGYLVKPGDSKAMAERMLVLLKDGTACNKLGENLGKKAREDFCIENFLEQYLGIYNSII
jgi:glycosyltransferase involved in cell wall biosynthesis